MSSHNKKINMLIHYVKNVYLYIMHIFFLTNLNVISQMKKKNYKYVHVSRQNSNFKTFIKCQVLQEIMQLLSSELKTMLS